MSGFFHLACFQYSSMLYLISAGIKFLFISLDVLFCSLVDGHLDCVHFLAVTNNATITLMYKFVSVCVCTCACVRVCV